MTGYTKPYLYVPEGLTPGSEYYVVLTEKDAITGENTPEAPTCPITVKHMDNPGQSTTLGPTSDYIAVTPTCVPRGGSLHILIHNENPDDNILGKYRIITVDGQLFKPIASLTEASTPVSFRSAPEGMYIVQVWSTNKESKESYRAVKVIVRSTCPNCDKSSF